MCPSGIGELGLTPGKLTRGLVLGTGSVATLDKDVLRVAYEGMTGSSIRGNPTVALYVTGSAKTGLIAENKIIQYG